MPKQSWTTCSPIESCTGSCGPVAVAHGGIAMSRGKWYWVKDLEKLKRPGFALERVLFVDDTPSKLDRNYGNLVGVGPFHGDPQDRVLVRLDAFLATLIDVGDVRRVEKRGWDGRDGSSTHPDLPSGGGR